MKRKHEPEDLSDFQFGMDMALTIAILMTVMMLLAMLNQNQNKEEDKKQEYGHLCAEIVWDPTYDTDMDVWGKHDDENAVGWSITHGKYMDLWRDDLGQYHDKSPINYEIICTRGIENGEHTFTVHYFADRRSPTTTVKVNATITFYPKTKTGKREIIERELSFGVIKSEKTIANFIIENGKLVPNSINSMDVQIGPGELR